MNSTRLDLCIGLGGAVLGGLDRRLLGAGLRVRDSHVYRRLDLGGRDHESVSVGSNWTGRIE